MKKHLVRLVAGFCLLATLARAADTVELLPGRITGTVQLSGETVNSGSVYASATDGSGSASTSFNGNAYSIIVPAGKTWKLNFSLSLANAGSSYSQLSVNPAEQITVGANQTVTQDFSITTTRVTADIQVANGTLSSIGYIQAYGNVGSGTNAVSFSGYTYSTGTVTVLPATGVQVYGTVNLLSNTGQASTVSLPGTAVDVPSTGATVSWSVDASFISSTIQGALTLTGSQAFSSAQVYFYGPDNSNAGQSFTSNGTFQFDNLKVGNYSGYAYANFTNTSLYLYRSATVAAGSVTTVNFISDLATANVGLNFTGFLDGANLYSANLSGYGPDNSSSNSNLTSAGGFAPVVTPGTWSFGNYSFAVYDGVTYQSIGSYNQANTANTATFAAGDNKTLPAINVNTTQTEFTFDVIEAPGATSETLISYPYLSGYAYKYSPTGAYLGQSSVYSQSYATNSAKPRVRLIGEPGTYQIQAYGNVEGSSVSFGNFTIELKEPLPTPTGTNVTVNPGAGTTLVFDQVTTAGVTTASQLPVGPALPGGYTNLTSGGQKIYYSISTTATFTGFVEVTVGFEAGSVPAELEKDLHLFYYDNATEKWIDITTSVDEAGNLVTGVAPALSTFALGLPHAPAIGIITVPVGALKDTALTFSAAFTDSDPGEAHTASWFWGDGSGNTAGVVSESSGTITGEHTFSAAGTFTGTLTLTDITGNVVTKTFTVTIGGATTDTTAPVISIGGNLTAEASGPGGAVVNFSATASDETDGSVAVTFSHASGSVFPVGTTTVTATATDAAGNVATKTFTVTVADTVKPVLSLPGNITVEATSATGAAATFTASATDNVDGSVAVTLSNASGSNFALGTTTVTATATDASGNTATGSFTVTVRDTVAPVVTTPANITAEATSAAGATVSFAASATDASAVTLAYSKASGSVFPVGTTTVNVTATDAAGNVTTKSFTVTVADSTKPVFTSLKTNAPTLWPPNHKMVAVTVSATASDAVGPVSYRIVSATSNEPDNGLGDGDTANDIQITGALTVNLRAERSGKGNGRTYTITVEAKDGSGNVTTKTVTVYVPKDQSDKDKNEKENEKKDDDKKGDDDKKKGDDKKSDDDKKKGGG